MRKRRSRAIDLSRNELIHLRRFLNRAVECCEGRCPQFTMPVWYYVEPIMKKVEAALKSLNQEFKTRHAVGMVYRQQPP